MDIVGYRALRDRAALLDLSTRGRIRVTGEDRARLLHAISTNHIQQLTPGSGCYAFFLDAQGHILADANIFCFEDHFLLETEPETAQRLYQHIDKYIIADDVALADVTAELVAVGVEGPNSADFLRSLGAPVPETPFSHAQWGSRTVAALSETGEPGFRIFLPAPEKTAGPPHTTRRPCATILPEAGLPWVDQAAIRTVRLEHGKPRYGEDIDERHIPQETQLMHAVSFSKGCYLGQEIVERVRSRGQVHRVLASLRIESSEPPAVGTEVLSDGNKAGEITSAAFSEALGEVVALAYIRREFVEKPLSVAGFRTRTFPRRS